MTRVGITPPEITVTADDKRLKAGKPAPDPFLLAAELLGYDCKKCIVFEDSPSGIKAGVASGSLLFQLQIPSRLTFEQALLSSPSVPPTRGRRSRTAARTSSSIT